MYYVDVFANELVKEREVSAPPERYYEYVESPSEEVVIETYVVAENPLKLFEFAYSPSDPSWLKTVQRSNHFKKHGVMKNDTRLCRYAVPPSWYSEEIAKYEKGRSNMD